MRGCIYSLTGKVTKAFDVGAIVGMAFKMNRPPQTILAATVILSACHGPPYFDWGCTVEMHLSTDLLNSSLVYAPYGCHLCSVVLAPAQQWHSAFSCRAQSSKRKACQDYIVRMAVKEEWS